MFFFYLVSLSLTDSFISQLSVKLLLCLQTLSFDSSPGLFLGRKKNRKTERA